MQQAKAYERLAVEAAVTGDRTVALKALLANPWSASTGWPRPCWTRSRPAGRTCRGSSPADGPTQVPASTSSSACRWTLARASTASSTPPPGPEDVLVQVHGPAQAGVFGHRERHPGRVEARGVLDGDRQARQGRLEQVVAAHRLVALPGADPSASSAWQTRRLPAPAKASGSISTM